MKIEIIGDKESINSMNRIEYVSSINFANEANPDFNDQSIISGIIKYFDEAMGIYNLVGDKSFKHNNACSNYDGSVSFNIELNSNHEADVLESIASSNSIINIYGRTFETEYGRVNDITVMVKVRPVQINYASSL